MPKKSEYKYFTEVQGGFGPYIVKHKTKKEQKEYEKKLKEQYPHFRKIRSGSIKQRKTGRRK